MSAYYDFIEHANQIPQLYKPKKIGKNLGNMFKL